MLQLTSYRAQSQIYESANSQVYRAIRKEDNQTIILKILKEDYPTPQELARYRTEYQITKSLNLPGVVKVYDLQKYQNTLVMSLEDFGGESLKLWMLHRNFTVEEFLQIAIAATDTLGQIHAANIIHKDINPSNIVYNPATAELKIIDFGISTKLTRTHPTLKNPNVLEGTLAYMSPEQTGRMNRSLDYRTDFYSLGVTFYELLTNKLPFETTDALELVHCHIAKQTLPPTEVNPNIPQVLSDIVMKLMAKTAEERYQSAFGIKADLEECLNQLPNLNNISYFPIAQQDIYDRFQLPQKLYGREQEIDTLLTAFERVSTRSELMLVGGYSGIGKSALVHELYKPITSKRGYFISGKFDQYQRNIPYSAVVSAFRELVKQLLSETEAQLKEWREKLLEALGINGQVIVDVIPEVELIIGKQPTVPKLGLNQSQNRFNLVFQNFIKVFTKTEHPLAIFIDDLQWADGASLKLMQLLMSGASTGLFLIGAYRDNEVCATHPLMLTLDEIIKTGAIINRISLSPLELPTVIQLISDTLNSSKERVKTLAELVRFKTGGNPFFMNEFLKSLYTEGILEFNFQTLSWQWDLELLEARGFTDNVVELMANKIQKLPEEAQKMLKLAACIGNQFDLNTLGLISETPLAKTVTDLHAAVAESLVVPVGNMGDVELAIASTEFPCCPLPLTNYLLLEYKFAHDRIQQAAYSLIIDRTKQAVHLQIGQLLLNNTPLDKREEKIFDIVNQLNFGTELITEQQRRDELAQLNLMAAKKAKASTAYQPAFNYLQAGIRLLAPDSWQTEYGLTLALYLEAAEVEYLNINFSGASALAEIALKNAASILDRVKVYELEMQISIAKLEMVKTIETGLKVLDLLGIDLVVLDKNNSLAIELPNVTEIETISVMTDLYKLAGMRILKLLSTPVFMARPEIFPQLILTMVNLCIAYGNSAISCFAYGFYGLLLVGFGKIDTGYHAGNIALHFLDIFDAKALKATVYNLFNSNIRTWKEPAKNSVVPLREGVQIGLETGELEWGGYCAANLCSYLFFTGSNLEVVVEQQTLYIDLCVKIKQEIPTYFSRVWQQLALNFLGKATNLLVLSGDSFDEVQIVPRLQQTKTGTVLYVFYVAKSILLYHFNDYGKALENVELANAHSGSALGFLQVPILNFYHSLAILALYAQGNSNQQQKYLEQVESNQKFLKYWAESAPSNNQHRHYLVEAEKARVLGKNWEASELYNQAISLAKENDYIHEEALSNELSAKFYLAAGQDRIASVYMQDARYCYQFWGAIAKVKDLENRYPELLSRKSHLSQTAKISTASTVPNTSDSTNLSALDLTTVMKASQALSGEIVLDKLLTKLMKILIENAGAQRGYLILSSHGKLQIEASGTIDGEQVNVLQSIPVSNCQLLSEAIVNYVARTKESVVLNDATREGKFTNDPYIKERQPKSILCLPLIKQGKLISIVYLENNRTARAFASERQEILNLLSAQAAISIENAQLYNNMAELNRAYERFVPRQFLHFLDKSSIVDVELGDQVQLEMSVLFSDIRDFTTMSEKMTPEDNFKFINSYLSRMEPAITENNGFIDKYIGDAIMALFSGEADNAVKAGITMLHRLQEYNQNLINSGYAPIQIGIGINTGSLMMGTVGGENRMDGTVISDAVNLASRIEGLTKNYGVSLLITEQTYSRLPNQANYAIRIIDTVKVKGKSQAVTVYEVFEADLPEIKERKLATLQIFTEALSLYNEGKFAEAAALFADCIGVNPGDKVAGIYLERSQIASKI